MRRFSSAVPASRDSINIWDGRLARTIHGDHRDTDHSYVWNLVGNQREGDVRHSSYLI